MTPAAKLRFPLGEAFFEELQRRVLSEFRVTLVTSNHKFTAGPGEATSVPVTSILLSAFDPKDSVIIEAEADLDVSYFEDKIKEKQDKLLAWVKEQAAKRGLTQLEGRWVPA